MRSMAPIFSLRVVSWPDEALSVSVVEEPLLMGVLMPDRLAGRTAIITGAARGQGLVAAEMFAREGARGVLGDIDKQGLEEVAQRIAGSGGDVAFFARDLTSEESNQQMVRVSLDHYGSIAVLFNAAGLVRFNPLLDTSLEDRDFTLRHELTIAFLACKHAIRPMLAAGTGSIISMSSASGLFSSSLRHTAHAATKAGIVGLTRQIAVTYGPQGVRCNAIAPGYAEYAPGQRRVVQQSRGTSAEDIPLRRRARPEDTAACALFLASDESSFITGETIVVDGGRSVQ
jgi:NAD(P)-dependent dehydrogenase (short-subunit alcohol dehydrogenase family)